MRQARMFEREDKIDSDFGGIEGFGGTMRSLEVIRVSVEVERRSVEI